MNILKTITKAFDIFYNLLEIVIKLGIVFIYLMYLWIRHLVLKITYNEQRLQY